MVKKEGAYERYRKIFKARYIVVWKDGSHHILENGYLAVEGKNISGYMSSLPEGAQYEDLGNAAIIPGFVNLHTHPSEVYSIKSYIEDCGNPNFLNPLLMDYPFPSFRKTGCRNSDNSQSDRAFEERMHYFAYSMEAHIPGWRRKRQKNGSKGLCGCWDKSRRQDGS